MASLSKDETTPLVEEPKRFPREIDFERNTEEFKEKDQDQNDTIQNEWVYKSTKNMIFKLIIHDAKGTYRVKKYFSAKIQKFTLQDHRLGY